MCGIAGIINWDNKPINKSEIEKMNSFLIERGPDSQGYWIQENIGFAHSRLSIIDLSPQGNQPMCDKENNVKITYNGEIYNYLSLKKELEKGGVRFSSNSDTEVLIYGYLEWGIEALLKKLNGMFAFAIWDTRNNECILARDRFGQKPLYYFQNNNQLVFCSDIRGIWAIKKSVLNIDQNTLSYFLSELSSHQPDTIWEQVKQIPPAHFYCYRGGNAFKRNAYWSLDYSQKINISFPEAVNELEHLLTKAVIRRTVSDVPIGSFLSGGVDSGLISSILAKNSKIPINTYTVGFDDENYDESKEALIVANKYGTNHTQLFAKNNIAEILDDLIEYFGEPFADDSNIPTYLICREVKKHCTVVLSGDGGDELFGGYHEYLSAHLTDEYLKITPNFKREALTFLSKLNRFSNKKYNLGHLKDYDKLSGSQKLHRGIGFSFIENNILLESQKCSAEKYLENLWAMNKLPSVADTLLNSSIKTRLNNSYLTKVDRSSMKNSLEVRSPFLDHEVAEFAAKLPMKVLFNDAKSKAIGKSLAQRLFDKNIHQRPKKGFGLPLGELLNTSLSSQLEEHLLHNSKLEDIGININAVKEYTSLFKKGHYPYPEKIWILLCLDKWTRIFM